MKDHCKNPIHAELERLAQAKLSQLPDLEAPPTLMPRVLAALEARAYLPWWRRAWLDWPHGYQVVSVVLMVFSAFALAWVLDSMRGSLPALTFSIWLTEQWAAIQAMASILMTLANSVILVGKSLLEQPIFWICLAFTGLMYLSMVGMSAVCLRFVFNRTRPL